MAFFIGAIFVGYNPYVTNTFKHHNPFYPIPFLGSVSSVGGSTELLSVQDVPANFHNKSSLIYLIRYVFSHQEVKTKPTEFKIPFTFSSSELGAFHEPDARASGFGVLFSGAVVLCFLSVLCMLKKWKFDVLKNPDTSIKLLIVFLLVISILINTYSWWARYAPQLWLFPIFSFFFLSNANDTILKYSRFLLIITLFVNIAMISFTYYSYQVVGTVQLNKELNYLASHSQDIKVNVGAFVATKIRLNEFGIKYENVPAQNDLKPWSTLFESYVNVYLPNNTG